MTMVKICGLTRGVDIEYANMLMPEYVGFVFASSKRQLAPEDAAVLIQRLKPEIKKVGVFVDEDIDVVLDTARICGLDVLQLHGNETPEYCRSIEGYEVWKAFRVEGERSIEEIGEYEVDGVLLDSFESGQHGGTGRTFDWNLAATVAKEHFTILAGGLSPENVKSAIEIVRPAAVDVSSGVETDGMKDYLKIKNS
ncbi:N-(5'-phosphoribosyl)anthranilate isomerase TrpF (plasmid) [Peptoclostridium acidaminophilum DSM 3953]|uniref:N-(5'-phosphoribosyl)anthranilate isomerase n=1 Tax=Peptoclostridium acidaminophilum DSM 3953 TaxID=1286171 RepID=W8TAE3_PEPAC|nr:phosphoribosylanthranilate isomerase [Peptoclostridium acidaminophilum]AHM57875.1 N-(5'-phosphoribosyl)anthranilate isomerase TrpF [Peptoclostridium acidaminophilum DSM 3953]